MHAGMMLGRVRPTSKQRAMAPRFKDHMVAPPPPAPAGPFSGAIGAAIAMNGNDRYGNCTFAALANYRAIRAKLVGLGCGTQEAAVIAAYLAFTGGQDVGAVETEVLQGAVKGYDFGDEVYQIPVWAAVPLRDKALCESLIAVFGAIYIGMELPVSAQNQEIWTPAKGRDGAPGSWGGHALLRSGWKFDADGKKLVEYVTWGARKFGNEDFDGEYVDEGYVLVDADSAKAANVDYEGLVRDAQYAAQAA